MMTLQELADEVVSRCHLLAGFSETPMGLTRTFLSPPMRDCHRVISEWMRRLGMHVEIDAIGNVRGVYSGTCERARRLIIGSHIDTVPDAGAFDGVLGVMIALALIDGLGGQRLPFAIEVIGFSEEEGIRFRTPFLGSRALLEGVNLELSDDFGTTIRRAIEEFGLDPEQVPDLKIDANHVIGYIEFHIEQGQVLEAADLPLGVVEGIAGQSRLELTFTGAANHAGTTPMLRRRDAIAAAAEWVVLVEAEALRTEGLVATVGSIQALPNAVNVIAGEVRVSLDIRHPADKVRHAAVKVLLAAALQIAQRRRLQVVWKELLNQSAVPMDPALVACAERFAPFRMVSGAGHDAMIMAAAVPAVMLFLRTPGGLSHHPQESVRVEDVASAIHAGLGLLTEIAKRYN